MEPMTDVETPHENDVLCGRGVTTNKHIGNERFRSLVSHNKELYVTSTKKEKMMISKSIVSAVRSMGGRFLEKGSSDASNWADIGDKKAIEKTSQALRDVAANLRKQLTDDLADLFGADNGDVTANNESKGHRRAKSLPNRAHSTATTSVKGKSCHHSMGEYSYDAMPPQNNGTWQPPPPPPPPPHPDEPTISFSLSDPTYGGCSPDQYDPGFLNAMLDMDDCTTTTTSSTTTSTTVTSSSMDMELTPDIFDETTAVAVERLPESSDCNHQRRIKSPPTDESRLSVVFDGMDDTTATDAIIQADGASSSSSHWQQMLPDQRHYLKQQELPQRTDPPFCGFLSFLQ